MEVEEVPNQQLQPLLHDEVGVVEEALEAKVVLFDLNHHHFQTFQLVGDDELGSVDIGKMNLKYLQLKQQKDKKFQNESFKRQVTF